MAQLRLFEVTLKYFVCADTKARAENDMLRSFGGNHTSMELKEIIAGFIYYPERQEEEEIPF